MTTELELAKKIIALAKETSVRDDEHISTYSKRFFDELDIHVPTSEHDKERFERICRKIKRDIHPDRHATESEAIKEIFTTATSFFNDACHYAITKGITRAHEDRLKEAFGGSNFRSPFRWPPSQPKSKPNFNSFTTCHEFLTEFNNSTYSSQDKTELFTIFLEKCPQIIKTFEELFKIVRSLNHDDAKSLIKTLEPDLIKWVNTYDSFYTLLSISNEDVKTLIQTSINFEFKKGMHRSSFYRFLDDHFKYSNEESRDAVIKTFFQNPGDLKKLLQTSPELFAKVYPHCKRLINNPESLLTLLTELTAEQFNQACRILRSSMLDFFKEQANYLAFYQNLSLENFASLCKHLGNFKPAEFIEFLTPPHDDYYNHLKALLIDIKTIVDALSTAPEYVSFFNAMKEHFLSIIFKDRNSLKQFCTTLADHHFEVIEPFLVELFTHSLHLSLEKHSLPVGSKPSPLIQEERQLIQHFLSTYPLDKKALYIEALFNLLTEKEDKKQKIENLLKYLLKQTFKELQSESTEHLSTFIKIFSSTKLFPTIITALKEELSELSIEIILGILPNNPIYILELIKNEVPSCEQLMEYLTHLRNEENEDGDYGFLFNYSNREQRNYLIQPHILSQMSSRPLHHFLNTGGLLWLQKKNDDLDLMHKSLKQDPQKLSPAFEEWEKIISSQLTNLREKINGEYVSKTQEKEIKKALQNNDITSLSDLLSQLLQEIDSLSHQLQKETLSQNLALINQKIQVGYQEQNARQEIVASEALMRSEITTHLKRNLFEEEKKEDQLIFLVMQEDRQLKLETKEELERIEIERQFIEEVEAQEKLVCTKFEEEELVFAQMQEKTLANEETFTLMDTEQEERLLFDREERIERIEIEECYSQQEKIEQFIINKELQYTKLSYTTIEEIIRRSDIETDEELIRSELKEQFYKEWKKQNLDDAKTQPLKRQGIEEEEIKDSIIIEESRKEQIVALFNNDAFQKSEEELKRALSQEKNSPYTTAASKLLNALNAAKEEFIDTGSLLNFKKSYTTALEQAKPTFEKHSGWKRILQVLLNGLHALLNGLGCSSQTLNKFGLFLKPRESSEKLAALEQHFNPL